MDKISIVIPCYNEEKSIEPFYTQLCGVLGRMRDTAFEMLFIDDGSTDETCAAMEKLASLDARVSYLSFSRNFGKEAAMYAGLSHAAGDFIVVMDADLQDPPGLLPEMYHTLKTGEYDCVATRRCTRRHEPVLRSLFARCFYKIFRKLSGLPVVDGARDFRMMTRQMAEAIVRMPEHSRFSKGIFTWVGFKTKWIEYENAERIAGETKWSFGKLMLYAFEGFAAFSFFPLVLPFFIGILLLFIFFVFVAVLAFQFFVFHNGAQPAAWLTALILVLAGLQFLFIGLLGGYISKISTESKQRPQYIVKKSSSKKSASSDDKKEQVQAQ